MDKEQLVARNLDKEMKEAETPDLIIKTVLDDLNTPPAKAVCSVQEEMQWAVENIDLILTPGHGVTATKGINIRYSSALFCNKRTFIIPI